MGTPVDLQLYILPHYLLSNPKRITDGEVGLLHKSAATAYIKGVVTLESK